MKTNHISPLVLLLVFAGLFQQCTIEKRRYLSGYHVDWHAKTGLSNQQLVAPEKADNPEFEYSFADTASELIPEQTLQSSFKDAEHLSIEVQKVCSKPDPTERTEELNSVVSLNTNEEPQLEKAERGESRAADTSLGLSRVSLVTTVGWILVLTQNFTAIAIGSVLLATGAACAIIALILAAIALKKLQSAGGSSEDKKKAKTGLRNALIFFLLGIAGLIGSAFVFGWF